MGTRSGIASVIRRIDALPRRWMAALLAAVFLFVHAVYAVLGVSFDTGMLRMGWQLLDPGLLREDLLRGVYYLHGQPPAYNVFVGAVLKLAGEHHVAALHGAGGEG